jgi:hypothetical protein
MADPKKPTDPGQPDRPEGSGSGQPLRASPLADKLAGGPGGVPTGVTTFVGLAGRSSRPGYSALWLDRSMSRCVEIANDDIVHSEELPPERSLFGALGGTRVYVRRGAQVVHTRTTSRTSRAEDIASADPFDLDVRLSAAAQALPLEPDTHFDTECGGGTGDGDTCLTCASCGDTCFRTCNDTCRTQCNTCPGDDTCATCRNTCQTCRTRCGTCATCNNTCQQTCATCQTACNQQTCATCQTACNQQTCNTCRTRCGTCVTCRTCRTQCGDTCDNTCATCPGDTCRACTHVTCGNNCGIP